MLKCNFRKVSFLVLAYFMCLPLFASSNNVRVVNEDGQIFIICKKRGWYNSPKDFKHTENGRYCLRKGKWHLVSNLIEDHFMDTAEIIDKTSDEEVSKAGLRILDRMLKSGIIKINSIGNDTAKTELWGRGRYGGGPLVENVMFWLIDNLDATKLFVKHGAIYTVRELRECQNDAVCEYLIKTYKLDPFKRKNGDVKEDTEYAYFSEENISFKLSTPDKGLRPKDYEEIGLAIQKLSKLTLTEVTNCVYIGQAPNFRCTSKEKAKQLVYYLNRIGLFYYYASETLACSRYPEENIDGNYEVDFIKVIMTRLERERRINKYKEN